MYKKASSLDPGYAAPYNDMGVVLEQLGRIGEAEKAYRRAVRLQYLKALKHLSDQGRVRLRADKTNRDYEAEISDQGVRQHFRQITYIFNHIWYGDLPIDQPRFEGTRAAFVAFERTLEGSR